MTLSRLTAVGLFLVATLGGCIPTSSSTARTPDGKTCGQRLVGGMWRFTGFNPDRSLNPEAMSAIERLHGSLRLGFDGQQALTTGPGLYHLGPYQIADDDGMSCRIIAPDDNRVVSETRVRFIDANSIEILDQRSAVPGRSTMMRVAPGQ